jgi:hypothetical protein
VTGHLGVNGSLAFLSLSPGEYFVKPMLKVTSQYHYYSFRTQSGLFTTLNTIFLGLLYIGK